MIVEYGDHCECGHFSGSAIRTLYYADTMVKPSDVIVNNGVYTGHYTGQG